MSNIKKTWLWIILCFLPVAANATWFSNGMDTSSWRLEASVFECRISHQIPYYGEAVFRTRAGERSQFTLMSDSSRLQTGQASIIARTPIYAEAIKSRDLGYVKVRKGLKPIQLNTSKTETLLMALFAGRDLWITRKPWYDAESSTKIGIAAVGFRGVYEAYQACLSDLLPANYDQIRRTSVYFGSGKHDDFSPQELKKLDYIAMYAKADPSVKSFYIDGHTDSVGSRQDNLTLAEKRAEEVTLYLTNKGVPKDHITSRWHGERYPVASNGSNKGRAKNRRVTIRLERMSAPKPMAKTDQMAP